MNKESIKISELKVGDMAFFKRRDERNGIILERLEFSGKSSFDGEKYWLQL